MGLLPKRRWTKLEALGNDFLVLESPSLNPQLGRRAWTWEGPLSSQPAFWQALADRHRGIGADQLFQLEAPHHPLENTVSLRIWNADGTEAESCGNGFRALGLYFWQYWKLAQVRMETIAGVRTVEVQDRTHIRVDMGVPQLQRWGFPLTLGELEPEQPAFEVNVGNPHVVIFLKEAPEESFFQSAGSWVEQHPLFAPHRTNVEFVWEDLKGDLCLRVWERGAGPTLACGSGACAAFVAYALQQKTPPRSLSIHQRGGTLWVYWKGPGTPVMLEGEARIVARGRMDPRF